MRRSFLYAALWLIGIIWTLSIWLVDAKETTQWEEWVDFESLDIKASNGETVLFTIMDRNLWATVPGTGSESYGFFYQWWNNYWFSSEAWTYPANTGTDLIDITWEWYGPWKYYSSDKFIIRTDAPKRWDRDESNETYTQYWNLNLWWWENPYNPDADRQWPCPTWYHIPDILEWFAAKDLWCKEKMNNTSCSTNNFKDDLLIPYAGRINPDNAGISHQNDSSYYWSSSSTLSAAASMAFYFDNGAFYPKSRGSLSRTYGFSVRCFKNAENTPTLIYDADNGEDNVVYNIRYWEPISKTYNFIPEKDGYRFLGWFHWDTKFNFSDSTFITGDTVLKAKWEKFPWYTYDASGGVFADQSSQNIIKFSRNVESSELSFGSYGSKKIEWATKMRAEIIVLEFVSADPEGFPIIYVYNHEKTNSTVDEDYVMTGTKESLSGSIEVEWDTIWFVVTEYFPGVRRIFNIIGESDYTSSWVVIQPTREWYTFDGWYVIENEVEIDFDPEADNEIADKTIYARWKEVEKYKISFDTDGWNEIEPIEVEPGSVIDTNTLPVAIKNCNEFLWWDGLVETMPANDITLKAKRKYKCSHNGSSWGGGWRISSSNSDSETHGSADEQKDSDEGSNEDSDSQNEDSDSQNEGSDSQGSDINYPSEWNNAYQFAYKNWITTMDSIEKAEMEWTLTRIAMAKMLSQYAINILGKKPANIIVPDFVDITDELDEEYDFWVTLAYQLWIMWINLPDNRFRPFDIVPRWEFATAISRMLYWIADWTDVYFSTHLVKLMEEWIITNDDPDLIELRWYIMIMLMRSAKK